MLRRLRILFAQFTAVTGRDADSAIANMVLSELVEELADHLAETGDRGELLEDLFGKCSLMLSWVATGQVPDRAAGDEFMTGMLARHAAPAALEAGRAH